MWAFPSQVASELLHLHPVQLCFPGIYLMFFLNSFGSNSLKETKDKVMVTGAIDVTKETWEKEVKANEWLWEWTGPFSE